MACRDECGVGSAIAVVARPLIASGAASEVATGAGAASEVASGAGTADGAMADGEGRK